MGLFYASKDAYYHRDSVATTSRKCRTPRSCRFRRRTAISPKRRSRPNRALLLTGDAVVSF
eukprot:6897361-Prymnesium_polylepis.1